jgi:outer membrane protein
MQNVKNQLDIIAYKQILIAKESIEQATENLRISNDQYKNGLEKMSNLLDAQSLLQQSKDKYVDSYAAYQKKCFEYLQVTGR